MIVALIINAQVIFLVSSKTYLPTIERADYANVETWFDGTLVYAHNYLVGSSFYDTDIVTVIYKNGSVKQFEVENSTVVDNKYWRNELLRYSTPDTITLATCYPKQSIDSTMTYLVQLSEVVVEEYVAGDMR